MKTFLSWIKEMFRPLTEAERKEAGIIRPAEAQEERR